MYIAFVWYCFQIVYSFISFLLSVGEVGFDSPAKFVGQPRMRVPPLIGGY